MSLADPPLVVFAIQYFIGFKTALMPPKLTNLTVGDLKDVVPTEELEVVELLEAETYD